MADPTPPASPDETDAEFFALHPDAGAFWRPLADHEMAAAGWPADGPRPLFLVTRASARYQFVPMTVPREMLDTRIAMTPEEADYAMRWVENRAALLVAPMPSTSVN